MKLHAIQEIVRDVPFTDAYHGKQLYEFIRRTRPNLCLELGFAHGTSSCYIAAALEENGHGHLTTLDLRTAAERKPSIYDLMQLAQLNAFITPVFAETSYNWGLMHIIEQQTQDRHCEPLYDFCFIDGAHTWDTDGFSFFLVEKLLLPGGWILFDDLNLAFDNPLLKDEPWLYQFTEEERQVCQVERVFSLLVRPNASIGRSFVDGNWGWAQKRSDSSREDLE